MDNTSTTTPRKKSGKTATAAAQPAKNGNASLHPIQVRDGAEAEAQSRQMLAALMAFADGDFGARLPVDWSGTDGRIAEAFNQSIAQRRSASRSEAARLSQHGRQGRPAEAAHVAAGRGRRLGRRRSTRSTR